MGNLRKWLNNKPILSDLEVHIAERDRRAKRISASFPPETSIYTSPIPDDVNSDCTLQGDVEEVKCFLSMHAACSFSKLLDWNGTGKLKRADLLTLFKKEGVLIPHERMNVLMSSLNSRDGDSVTVEDLVAAIQTWSRRHQERKELNSNNEKKILSGHHLKTHGEERVDQECLRDVEVLAIMRRCLTSSPSALSGSMGREVDRFRRLCFIEYLKSLEQCQRWELNVSQATLQRVLLHPGDMNLYSSSKLLGKAHFLGCSGPEQGLTFIRKPKTHQVQEGAHKRHRDKKTQSIGWADPNAFWPGKEDHVRLFLPVKTSSPAMVLFQRIEHTAVPSPGHWPVNHLGYSTSGDIEARKMYSL